ncbi:MAG: chorismate mutase [Proteocatella sp.]|nr:chorismate mutase [Proteocatella sp.]
MIKTNDLSEIRESINEVDQSLAQLFEKRMELVALVAEYKIENDIPILNSEREKQVIDRALESLRDKSLSREMEIFFNELMAISREYQSRYIDEKFVAQTRGSDEAWGISALASRETKNLKIGFQGVEGSFSEEALLNYFGKEAVTSSFRLFEDVFKAIDAGDIDYGILPVENSSTGSVNEVYDLLRKYGCHINGEIVLKVKQNLLGVKGASMEDIKEVYSHSQGFQQSAEFFKEHSSWKLIPYHNTALGAKLVSEAGDISRAAVASERAAAIYGLDILKENLNFNSKNYTRFVIVGKDLELDESSDKISVVLTVRHKAGSLCDVLRLFSQEGLNLLKIESRPIMDKSWEYFFHLDFEGNLQDPHVSRIMDQIRSRTTYFKILGNYRRHR